MDYKDSAKCLQRGGYRLQTMAHITEMAQNNEDNNLKFKTKTFFTVYDSVTNMFCIYFIESF